MEYQLIIMSFKENENYAQELSKYDEDVARLGFNAVAPDKYIPQRKMFVTLNEAEYQAIKLAVLEKFK